MHPLVLISIIIVLVVLIYLFFRCWFILNLRKSIKRYLLRLDFFIQHQSDLFGELKKVLKASQISDRVIDDAIFPAYVLATADFRLRHAQLERLDAAQQELRKYRDIKEFQTDENFNRVITNLDDLNNNFSTFQIQYNKEVQLFNRHLKLPLGRLARWIFRINPQELL